MPTKGGAMKRLLAFLILCAVGAGIANASQSSQLYCDDIATPDFGNSCAVTGATGVVTIPLYNRLGERLKNGALDARGTWSGATCAVQASINGTDFVAVLDSAGAAVSLTADGGAQFLTLGNGPWKKARLNCTGGAGGTSLTVTAEMEYQ